MKTILCKCDTVIKISPCTLNFSLRNDHLFLLADFLCSLRKLWQVYFPLYELFPHIWTFSPYMNFFPPIWTFFFKYNLGQKYYAPQVQPDRGSNSWPPDHDSTVHVTEIPALTTQPSVTSTLSRWTIVASLSGRFFLKYFQTQGRVKIYYSGAKCSNLASILP